MTGGGGAPRIFHRRWRRGFMVGVGGVRPHERAMKQRTRRTGVFSGFTGPVSATSPVISAGPLVPIS